MSTGAAGRCWVLHVDLDEFLAAAEVLRRPELAGRAIVVGGTGEPTARTVVATASYAARALGVRSGMPMRAAARALRDAAPPAVFLPTDPEYYLEVSERVMAVLRGFSHPVEAIGWDEAFVGLEPGPDDTPAPDPEPVARAIQAAIRARTGLVATVGIGDDLLRAKMATGFGKPAGIFTLTRDNWFALLGDRPTDVLHGVGKRTARTLAERGLHTVAQLAAADPAALAADLGPVMGPHWVALGRGISRVRVDPAPWVPRSHGHETTFPVDLTDPVEIRAATVALARRVAADVAADGRPAARVGVVLRFVPFTTRTRSLTLPTPTVDADSLASAALTLLDRFDRTGRDGLPRPVRLIGVRAEFLPAPSRSENHVHSP